MRGIYFLLLLNPYNRKYFCPSNTFLSTILACKKIIWQGQSWTIYPTKFLATFPNDVRVSNGKNKRQERKYMEI